MQWLRELDEKVNVDEREMPDEFSELVSQESITSYLIPVLKDKNELQRFLSHQYVELAKNEFSLWCFDPSFWPAINSIEKFNELFRVEHHSCVLKS